MTTTVQSGHRVLMLLENAPYLRDGRVRHEAAALVEAGYQVTVIGPAFKGEPCPDTVDGVRLHWFPYVEAGSGLFGCIAEYAYALGVMFVRSLWVWVREGFDILHVHSPPDALSLIAVFYKLWGKQYVYDHHDLSPDLYRVRFNDGGKGLVFHALVFFERLSCRLADRIIATNESHRAVEIERGGAQAGRITVVRNGSYLGQAEGAQPDPGVRGSANTVIAYAGVIGYQDGVDYLIRALAHLVGGLDRRDFRCLICGTGDALPEVQALVGEFGLESYVRFTGWLARADLVPRLLAADICVAPEPSNPYNDRSTMIKLMEYMALGKPTVAFDLPEHRVTAGEAAVYATPNDELDFARQIARLMDAPDLRARLGRVGKMRIETGLAWPYQAKKLLAAYASLCG